MLIAFHQIIKTELHGADGDVGHITDLFVDASTWQVRYLVVETGHWLPDRQVLLPPAVLTGQNWGSETASVALTKQQVKDSPEVDTQKPVSRQKELAIFKHYQIPLYWGPAGAAMAGGSGVVAMDESSSKSAELDEPCHHLRSAREMRDYYIKASDGDMGHVEDFLVDDQAWMIRYFAVDTKNWLPARKVLVSPQWIQSISWDQASIHVDLTRDRIKDSPDYDPVQPVNRGYEAHLYDYYGREQYWLPETDFHQPTGIKPSVQS